MKQKNFLCKTAFHNFNKILKERETNRGSVTTYYDKKISKLLIFIVDRDYYKLKKNNKDIINTFNYHI